MVGLPHVFWDLNESLESMMAKTMVATHDDIDIPTNKSNIQIQNELQHAVTYTHALQCCGASCLLTKTKQVPTLKGAPPNECHVPISFCDIV